MNKSEVIRVMLVDDHAIVRKGVIFVMEEVTDIHIIGEAANGEDALELCKTLSPDVVLLDVKMEGMDGFKVARAISEQFPQIKMIALSTFGNLEIIRDMKAAGVDGYLLKEISSTELFEAIRQVHAGHSVFTVPQNARSNLLDKEDSAAANDTDDLKFGDQQQRVMALMAGGFTNPEIAKELSISVPTARYHVSAILKKLGAINRSEAVAMAIRLGVLRE